MTVPEGIMDLRKIDALVAEHIFGWHPTYSGDRDSWNSRETGYFVRYRETFRPSEDIAAAWEVVEAMKHLHPRLSYCDTTCSWSCTWQNMDRDIMVVEDTAPLAICLAALKAKGISVE
jgi:hypothetical protein